jgi:hypothetical protein
MQITKDGLKNFSIICLCVAVIALVLDKIF